MLTPAKARAILLCSGIVAAVALVALISFAIRAATAPPDPPVTPIPTMGTMAATPDATAGPNDADLRPAAPDAAAATVAQEFVTAWLERDPRLRADGLQRTAVPALAEGLTLTRADKVPDWTPDGPPTPEAGAVGAMQLQMRQRFTSGDQLRLLLVADPDAPHGWLVQDIAGDA